MELKVEVDTKSGFCYGVVRAIEEAEIFLDKNRKLYSLGSIVHNNTELDRLKKKGMEVVNHDDMKELRDSVLFIRAHGEPPSSYETARKNNLRLIDCTCPVVLKLQKRIKEHFEEVKKINGQLLIFGKKGHAEVNGLVGQTDGQAIVIEHTGDLDSIDYTRPVVIFSQTTKDLDEYREICKIIEQKIQNAGAPAENFKSFNTICGQVSSRHPHLKDFAAKHSVIVFVSGKESSNGKILFESCKSVNPRSYKIESIEEIEKGWFNDGDSVGVCGATSTPKWLLEEVAGYIKGDLFVNVILPLKFKGEVTYRVPERFQDTIQIGSVIRVNFANKEYNSVVSGITHSRGGYDGKIKEVIDLRTEYKITEAELKLWDWMAMYYLCTPGEVYKAAYPSEIAASESKRKRRTTVKEEREALPELSPAQTDAFLSIKEAFNSGKVALLNGITGSGKTEIYIRLASEIIEKGESVLLLVPEIAMGRQLSSRLEKVFGESLLVYHSKQTRNERERVRRLLQNNHDSYLVLGTRSSLFLPFSKLGLVIVDEEHDQSYKQADPAPRYNGRDTALILAGFHSAHTLLGSATPSLETLYNTQNGRYALVRLNERYYGTESPDIEIVDTVRERKFGRMEGEFSRKILEAIKETIESKEQVMVFRNRRSYSPMVQCMYCDEIPVCPHCNVSLSYHKSRNELRCHYCNYSIRFNTICTKCGNPGLRERGIGTEKVEERLKEYFPSAKIERFDFETTRSSVNEKKILKEFAQGKTEILVGTQMLSKGFDFEHLSLICVLNSESMLSVQDFRAEERAFQMLRQLAGRAGRKHSKGRIMIQTSRATHPIYQHLLKNPEEQEGTIIAIQQLNEREEYGFPPFVRLIKITLKSANIEKLKEAASMISDKAPLWGAREWNGPFTPPLEKLMDEHQLQFWIKLSRNNLLYEIKSLIAAEIEEVEKKARGSVKIIIDVDPN
ncbi:MAG: primosomal protein N' [Rikenellaceae bacterium]|nr:primosomal protein N' [Rikenellaceae bacterium]